jgi:hypothetical protein
LIDADDTLWENNIYFEQALHAKRAEQKSISLVMLFAWVLLSIHPFLPGQLMWYAQ